MHLRENTWQLSKICNALSLPTTRSLLTGECRNLCGSELPYCLRVCVSLLPHLYMHL